MEHERDRARSAQIAATPTPANKGAASSAVTSGEAPQGPYEGPEWVFTAPAGSTIAGGSVTATLTSPHGQAWLGTPNANYDSADMVANCQYNLACGAGRNAQRHFPDHASGRDEPLRNRGVRRPV